MTIFYGAHGGINYEKRKQNTKLEMDFEESMEKRKLIWGDLDFTALCLFLKMFQRNKNLNTLKNKSIINYKNRGD